MPLGEELEKLWNYQFLYTKATCLLLTCFSSNGKRVFRTYVNIRIQYWVTCDGQSHQIIVIIMKTINVIQIRPCFECTHCILLCALFTGLTQDEAKSQDVDLASPINMPGYVTCCLPMSCPRYLTHCYNIRMCFAMCFILFFSYIGFLHTLEKRHKTN